MKLVSVIIALLVVGVVGFYLFNSVPEVDSYEFDGRSYTLAYEDSPTGLDYTASFQEWAPSNETLDDWTSLITFQVLTPKDGAVLSAETYAQNLFSMHTEQEAQILETSHITEVAPEIDSENPPYLLVYLYPLGNNEVEISLLKVQSYGTDGVAAFVYSERKTFSSGDALNAYLEDEVRNNLRAKVILAPFLIAS